MRNRREVLALGITAIICVVVVLAIVFLDLGWREADEVAPEAVAPEPHNIVEEAPQDVQDPPPSAVGEIDEP